MGLTSKPTVPESPVTHGDDDHVVGQAGNDPNNDLDRCITDFEGYAIFVLNPKGLGRCGIDHRCIVPRNLGDGVRRLEEQRVITEAAVVEMRVSREHDFEVARR